MAKVLYFLAGGKPTSPETAAIAKLNTLAVPLYEVVVLNGAENAQYGTDDEGEPRLIPHDFVAGTIPDEYSESTEIDPDEPAPLIGTGADLAVVFEGQEIAGTGGTFTVTVTAGVVGGTWDAD